MQNSIETMLILQIFTGNHFAILGFGRLHEDELSWNRSLENEWMELDNNWKFDVIISFSRE